MGLRCLVDALIPSAGAPTPGLSAPNVDLNDAPLPFVEQVHDAHGFLVASADICSTRLCP